MKWRDTLKREARCFGKRLVEYVYEVYTILRHPLQLKYYLAASYRSLLEEDLEEIQVAKERTLGTEIKDYTYKQQQYESLLRYMMQKYNDRKFLRRFIDNNKDFQPTKRLEELLETIERELFFDYSRLEKDDIQIP